MRCKCATSVRWSVAALPFFLCCVASFFNPVHATTTVTARSECERTVMLKIEIYSDTEPLSWTDEGLEKMDPETRERVEELMMSHTSYGAGFLAHVAEQWQAEIDSVWNGPTDEQVRNAAEDLGVNEKDRRRATRGLDNELREKLDDHARQMLAAAGGDDACTEINCCKVYFKIDVKVRGEEPTPGYHQIEVMVTDYRSNVRAKDGSLEKNHSGTTGRWAYDPHDAWDASSAHEAGHLMGLDDEYHEGGGHNEGHDHDVMNDSFGWPQSDSIQRILDIAGLACDCCPKEDMVDGLFMRFGSTERSAGDAMLTTNCPVLRQLLDDYQAQLANVAAANINMTDKANLTNRLNQQITNVRAALERCGPPPSENGFLLGMDLTEWCRFTPENMTPVPIPGATDDPKDIPIGGGDDHMLPPTDDSGAPTDDGEDPSDSPASGETSSPVAAGGSVTVTPGDGTDGGATRDDPRQDEGQQEPGTAPPVYLNAKATSTAVEMGAAAGDISGLQIKLYPAGVVDPPLPGGDVVKDENTGADQGPVQGVTGEDGSTRIAVDPAQFGITDVTVEDILVEINIDPTISSVVAPAGTLVPGAEAPDVTLSIGTDDFWVFYLAEKDMSLVVDAGKGIEVNLCGEKKPVGRGSLGLAALPGEATLPGAVISLPLPARNHHDNP
ncbi:MAG: hypothetical protein WC997_05260 [Porticoccaceae bacterium]